MGNKNVPCYHCYLIVLEALIKAVRYETEIRGVIIRKEIARLSLSADGVFIMKIHIQE